MVARFLKVVHDRYRDDATSAAILLDHLIRYLCLAMNRGRVERPCLAAETTLINGFFALREAEHEIARSLTITHREPIDKDAGGPNLGMLFPMVRTLVEEGVHAGATELELTLAFTPARVNLHMHLSNETLSSDRRGALTESLVILMPSIGPPIQLNDETGASTYVLQDVCR